MSDKDAAGWVLQAVNPHVGFRRRLLISIGLCSMALGYGAGPARAQQGILLQSADISTQQVDGNPLSWSHTVRAGNDLYLVVGVGSQGTNNDVSMVTYGSSMMTSLGPGEEQGTGFGGRVQLFGLDLNNSASDLTNTITVTFPGNTQATGGAMGFSGVGSVGSVTSTQGSSLTPTIANIAGANTGDLMVDIEANNDKAITASANAGQSPPQTEKWDRAIGPDSSAGGRTSQSIRGGVGGTSNSMNWTLGESRRWVIAGVYLEPTYLTAIRLESFNALRDGARVRLDWRTGFELDNLGFHLYRQRGARRERITPQPILGSGLSVGPGISMRAGANHTWSDAWAGSLETVQYWLEDISLSGASRWHGPIVPQARPPESGPSSPPLPLWETTRTNSEDLLPRSQRRSQALEVTSPRPAPANRFKVEVSGEGVYRVRRASLIAAGLAPDVDLRRLRLTRQGKEIATLSDEDGIEFFGTGSDTPWSDVGVYWLTLGGTPATELRRIAGDGPPSDEVTFRETAERRERSIYLPVLHNGDAENFFGPVIGPSPAEATIHLETPDLQAAADLEVAVQGASLGEHRIQVFVNQAPVGEALMQDRGLGVLRAHLAGGLLRDGDNQIALRPLGGAGDISVLDFVRIGYERSLKARGDRLRFSAPAGRTTTIEGFATAEVRVLDVTDPATPIELSPVVSPLADGYRVQVGVPAAQGRRTLLAFTAASVASPLSLAAAPPRDWAKPHPGADILIVGHQRFLPAVEPLRALRTAEGWTVAVADIQDVYDDFAHGQRTPHALRAFIETARATWARPPRFVLLVGDATFDPRDHLGRGDFDFVPTKLVATRLVETASDDWFVTPRGAAAPDIAIGRLPVRTREETERVVSKIVAFGQGEGRPRTLFQYTDHADDLDFESGADQVVGPALPYFVVEQLRRRDAGEGTRKALLGALERGPLVVGYLGHGSEAQWAGSVLTSADAANLGNLDRPWLALSMTCLNGGFHDVYKTTLAESLLLAERSGALAVWASSALTPPADQIALNRELLRSLLMEGTTLGQAILRAKSQIEDGDVRGSWILFGDPAVQFSKTLSPVGAGAPGSGRFPNPPAGVGSAGCSCQAASPSSLMPFSVPAGLLLVLRLGRRRKPKPTYFL